MSRCNVSTHDEPAAQAAAVGQRTFHPTRLRLRTLMYRTNNAGEIFSRTGLHPKYTVGSYSRNFLLSTHELSCLRSIPRGPRLVPRTHPECKSSNPSANEFQSVFSSF